MFDKDFTQEQKNYHAQIADEAKKKYLKIRIFAFFRSIGDFLFGLSVAVWTISICYILVHFVIKFW